MYGMVRTVSIIPSCGWQAGYKAAQQGDILKSHLEVDSAKSMTALEHGDPRMAEPILTGLIGEHIQNSRSPEMHMREAASQHVRLAYKLFDLAEPNYEKTDLARMLDAVESAGFSGVNITHPFKQQVTAVVHELADDARQIGAANTVLFREGKRIGHNTDCSGFSESFRRQLPGVHMNKVVQLGAGGAGAASAMAMLKLGCGCLAIFDVEASRAQDLVDRYRDTPLQKHIKVASDLATELANADGVINATPIGMERHAGSPLPPELLRSEMWVAEIVYFPLETQLLRDARERGCRTADGGQMAVFQAALAFELFTGRRADRERMLTEFNNIQV